MRIFLILLSISGIFNPTFAKPKELKIAVLYWSSNIAGQVVMRKGLEEKAIQINKEANKKGEPTIKLISYVAGDGTEGVQNQIKQMNTVVENGNVDLIIIQPTDIQLLTAPLLKANNKNIPVIAYDQFIAGGQLVSYITSNNFQAGYLNGEFIASKFDNAKILRIIIVEYPKVSSTVERVNGLISALKDYNQKYKIIKTYEAVEPIAGKKVGKQILKDFPKKGEVDVLFTVNDGGGLSVVKELSQANRNEIFGASVDGDPESVKNIENNNITKIDPAQFCGEIGRKSLDVAYRYLTNEKVPRHVLVPVFPITNETRSFYNGWLAPMPKKIKKSWKSKNTYWKGEYIEKF